MFWVGAFRARQTAPPPRCDVRRRAGMSNPGKEATGLFHVRLVAAPKTGDQVLFFDSRSDDEQTKHHNAGQKEEPVRRDQRNCHHEQRGRVVERMPDPAIGALENQVCVRRVTTVSVRLLPRQRKVHTSSPPATAITPTPVHLSQTGRGIWTMPSSSGLTIQAISPSQKTAPRGRNVARMNRPSCRRSSFSRVACDWSLW